MSADARPCPTCHGEGEVRVPGYSVNPRSGVRGPDPQCDDVDRCPDCGGRRIVDPEKRP